MSFVCPWELISFDLWHVTVSPPIGKYDLTHSSQPSLVNGIQVDTNKYINNVLNKHLEIQLVKKRFLSDNLTGKYKLSKTSTMQMHMKNYHDKQ